MVQRQGPSGKSNRVLIAGYSSCSSVRLLFHQAKQCDIIAVLGRGTFQLTENPGVDTGDESTLYIAGDTCGFQFVGPLISSTFSYVDFVDVGVPAWVPGRLYYNDNDLSLMSRYNNVSLQFGKELQIDLVNDESSSMPDGCVIYASGAQGQRLAVKKFANGISDLCYRVAGLSTMPIGAHQEGAGTWLGLVHDQNTLGWTVGGEVYSSAVSGVPTQTRPPGRVSGTAIGLCMQAHPTQGIILVRTRPLPRTACISSERPTNPREGETIFDATLGKPIWAKTEGGSTWVDASGTTV